MNSPDKFKSLVHYVCSRRTSCPDTLGAIKLNKVLWLSDMNAFYELGHAITDSRYIKQKFGPVPARIMPTLRELEREGILTVREKSYYGKQKTEHIVHTSASPQFMNADQIKIVTGVIKHVCDEHTAKSISDASHDHIWMAAEDGEEIPLYTVFSKPGKITDAEREWAQIQLESATT